MSMFRRGDVVRVVGYALNYPLDVLPIGWEGVARFEPALDSRLVVKGDMGGLWFVEGGQYVFELVRRAGEEAA